MQFNIQNMFTLSKMQLHFSQWETSSFFLTENMWIETKTT